MRCRSWTTNVRHDRESDARLQFRASGLWFANRTSPDMPNTCTQSCCICRTGNILWALLRSCAMSAVLPVILSLVFVRMPIVLIFDLCKCAAPAPTLLSRRLMRPIASFPKYLSSCPLYHTIEQDTFLSCLSMRSCVPSNGCTSIACPQAPT